jgi:site-specific DNA recombinase
VRLAISPDDGPIKRDPDAVLLRLVAHAFAAQDLLVRGISSPMVNHYKQRHLQQLVRLSFMAPDIISAIIDGSQPPDLTGRKIMRINKIPLDWAGQRKMLGFTTA